MKVVYVFIMSCNQRSTSINLIYKEHPKMWALRVSSNVGHSPTRFQIIMDWRCSHVDKYKPPINHIMVTYQNVEGCDHGLLDFHAPTKSLFNLQMPVTEGLKTGFKKKRRRLVDESGFKKMRVASWGTCTLPHQIPSTFRRVCPYSHQNLTSGKPTWKLTPTPTHCQAHTTQKNKVE